MLADPKLAKIRAALLQGAASLKGYTLQRDQLLFKGRLVIRKHSPLISSLLHEFHGSKIGGHSWVLKTYKRLAMEFYWKGMRRDVDSFVAA